MAAHEFRFDPAYRLPLALAGIRPTTSWVIVDDDAIDVSFGPWHLRTSLSNVKDVRVTGPYSAVRAIGARGSFTDLGVTFGSSTAGGTCVCFRERVPALVGPLVRHPGMTVTVVDPEALVSDLVEHGVVRASASTA